MDDNMTDKTSEQRLAKVEGAISSFGTHIEHLADEVHHQGETLRADIKALWEANRMGGRTNWGWILSGVAVFISIGGIITAVLKADINRLEHYQEVGVQEYISHVRDGHPLRISERIDEIEKHFDHRLSVAEADLRSRKGMRFNRPDGVELARQMREGDKRVEESIRALLIEKSRDRFTGAEGRMFEKRLEAVEQEQRRRSTAGKWKE